MSAFFNVPLDVSEAFILLFFGALLFFTAFTFFFAYHWFSYGSSRRTSMIVLAVHLSVGALLFLSMAIVL